MAMAEEFHESDVIFSDINHHRRFSLHDEDDSSFNYNEMFNQNRMNSRKRNNNNHINSDLVSSLPIKIPENIFRYATDTDEFEEEWESTEEEIVPPHIIVARRLAGKMAFSVCTGSGRTLKGRDLSQVRNSILRMTGFLET